MPILDQVPSAICNKCQHIFIVILNQAGNFVVLIFCLGWRRLEGQDGGCAGEPLEETAELYQSHRVTTLSALRIPGMPSACVTVIITSHYLTVEGGGIWCHCRVTEVC